MALLPVADALERLLSAAKPVRRVETVALHEAEDRVLAEDVAGLGTNALAVTPPTRIATCFGRDDSGVRHRDRASTLGLRLALVHSEGLAHDLDRPEDLATLTHA